MTNRILFEGPDDKNVVMNLLFNHMHEGGTIESLFAKNNRKEMDGIDHLLATLREEIGATDLSRLAVIVDADTDVAAQWARVSPLLQAAGCIDVPAAPDPDGTVVETPDGKRIGIWVMPDNQSAGALEDFVAMLIADEDTLWPKAQDDVDNIPEDDRRFKKTYHSKAQVHTWLAWQEEPGTRMGETFKKKYLDAAHPQAQAFANWLTRLLRRDAEAVKRD